MADSLRTSLTGDVCFLFKAILPHLPLDAAVRGLSSQGWLTGFLHAHTSASAEAARRTQLELRARLDGRHVGCIFASPPRVGPLWSFWQRVLLGVRMLCCLGKLGRRSRFQVSPTCYMPTRCLVGSTLALCLPQRMSWNIAIWTSPVQYRRAVHTH